MRVRIRCRGEAPTGALLCGVVPSFVDVEVLAIGDDGSETVLTNVQRVEIDIQANADPIMARLTFVDVELDIEARVEERLATLPSPAWCARHGLNAPCPDCDEPAKGDEVRR